MRKALSVGFALLFSVHAFAQSSTVKSDTPTISAQTDVRQAVFAAALILGGYSADDSNPEVAALRATILLHAADIEPRLRLRLTDFYRTHRRANMDETTDGLRYRALAVMVNDPPSFRFDIEDSRVPEDVRPLVGFEQLAAELYASPKFRKYVPELVAAYRRSTERISRLIAPTVNSLVTYFRTQPLDRLEVPAVRNAEGAVIRPPVTRLRRLKVFIDPVLGGGAVAVRGDLFDGGAERDYQRIGDRYAVFGGPEFAADESALRLAVIRFIVDPVVLAQREDAKQFRDQVESLVAGNDAAMQKYKDSPLLLVTDSLVSAANARYLVRSNRMSENGALAYLGDARARGEVLAIHFYERLKQFEQTGLDLATYFPDLVHTFSVDREATRDADVAAAHAALEREPKPATPADTFATDILLADKLISEKEFAEARPILERILKTSGDNARALFGLAQVIENSPDPIEKDAKSTDEDRINAQAERLESSVNLYRRAALAASAKELWLASWSHVYAGRILDFLELRDEALNEYAAAVKVGDVSQGAFKEAKAGLAAPYVPATP